MIQRFIVNVEELPGRKRRPLRSAEVAAHCRQWGKNIRAQRKLLGWKQETLAELCGLSASALANIEAGRRCPSDETKWRLAGALRKPVDELFAWPDDVPPFPQYVAKAAS